MQGKSMMEKALIENPRIFNYLDISTGHMTEEDDKLLKESEASLVVYSYEYGYFVHVPDLKTESSIIPAFREHGFSEAFSKIMEYAQGKGFAFVRFDSDGAEYEELPMFNW